MQGEVCCQPVA
uniref:Uncharacterized protein n=1 Tax=Anguilla anguilla TaxID=7936 RepID=A0A0E9R883_ANGAN